MAEIAALASLGEFGVRSELRELERLGVLEVFLRSCAARRPPAGSLV